MKLHLVCEKVNLIFADLLKVVVGNNLHELVGKKF